MKLLLACSLLGTTLALPVGKEPIKTLSRHVRSLDPMDGGGRRRSRSYEGDVMQARQMDDMYYEEEMIPEQARINRNPQTEYAGPGSRNRRQSGGGRGGGEPAALMPYRFGYAVKDDEGNDFNQQEQSDGQQITGQYSVLLPDGRIQTVTYSVTPDSGFVAEVTYTEAAGGGGGFGGDGGGFGK